MANPELPKGYREKSAAEMAADHATWVDSRPTVTRCFLAPCRGGVLHVGAAADGRAAAQSHRELKHPDHAPKRARLSQEQQRERAMLASAWKRKRFQGIE
jgi:hypothetical protein